MPQLPVRLVSHRHLFSIFKLHTHLSRLFPSYLSICRRRAILSLITFPTSHPLKPPPAYPKSQAKVISSHSLRPMSQTLGSMSHIAHSTFRRRRSPLGTHLVGTNITGLERFLPFSYALSVAFRFRPFVFFIRPAFAFLGLPMTLFRSQPCAPLKRGRRVHA